MNREKIFEKSTRTDDGEETNGGKRDKKSKKRKIRKINKTYF